MKGKAGGAFRQIKIYVYTPERSSLLLMMYGLQREWIGIHSITLVKAEAVRWWYTMLMI